MQEGRWGENRRDAEAAEREEEQSFLGAAVNVELAVPPLTRRRRTESLTGWNGAANSDRRLQNKRFSLCGLCVSAVSSGPLGSSYLVRLLAMTSRWIWLVPS